MTEYDPTDLSIVDEEIFHEMTVLEEMITFYEHQHETMALPIPDDLAPFLPEGIQREWQHRSYSTVRFLWADACMSYYELFYGITPSFDTITYANSGVVEDI